MSSNITETDYAADYDYTWQQDKELVNNIQKLYKIAYLIICSLGLILNFYVIIASCCVYHKLQKPPVSVWILALAVTHLVFSGFLVLQLLQAWHKFTWWYGVTLCKLSSYIFYANMFSTAAMLSLWSISCWIGTNRCLKWLCAACCGKGTSMDIIFVLISWMLGAGFSIPSLLTRKLQEIKNEIEMVKEIKCVDDFGEEFLTVVFSRFLLGILVPMLVMGICACLSKQQGYHVEKTCKRFTCAIKVAFFVCWSPLLFLGLVHATAQSEKQLSITYKFPVANVLAAAHCVINPVIYLLVGRKIKMQGMPQI